MSIRRFKFFYFSFSFFICFSISLRANEIGKSISLEGEVKIKRNENLIDAKLRDTIFSDDIVITGKRSNARFLLNDDTIIDLKELSQFKFKKLSAKGSKRNAEFELDFGRMRASVNKKISKKNNYQFKTKATVFAVRGTDFTINSPGLSQANLTVFEGKVSAGKFKRKIIIKSGFEFVKNQERAKLNKLSQEQIEKVFVASRAEDVNFFQNVIVGDIQSSRNLGYATINTINKITVTPQVQIPRNAIKIPGINKVSAAAVSPGALNYVISNIGVKIQ